MNLKNLEHIALRCAASLTMLAAVALHGSAAAQTFSSGSTGADGALDLTGTPSGTTVYFKRDSPNDDPAFPSIEDRLGRALNWDDARFDFTTITIPSGVTLRLTDRWTKGALYWLASGDVYIAGTLDLSGSEGHPSTRSASGRSPAIPGPGGYSGGVGGHSDVSRGAARAGSGPNGGLGAPNSSHSWVGLGANSTLSEYLVPLRGGSGGGGGRSNRGDYWAGGGGGAGGGAILIASSASINVVGNIYAYGGARGPDQGGGNGCGNGEWGGGGAGGAIRLAATTIEGGGQLHAGGGWACDSGAQYAGSSGRVRLEAFQRRWTFRTWGEVGVGSPFGTFLPSAPPPAMRVTNIAGVSVPSDATGSFSPPDLVFNRPGPVDVIVAAQRVPVGTTPSLVLISLDAPEQTLTLSPLQGTPQESTSTTQITFPPGFTRGYVRANW